MDMIISFFPETKYKGALIEKPGKITRYQEIESKSDLALAKPSQWHNIRSIHALKAVRDSFISWKFIVGNTYLINPTGNAHRRWQLKNKKEKKKIKNKHENWKEMQPTTLPDLNDAVTVISCNIIHAFY